MLFMRFFTLKKSRQEATPRLLAFIAAVSLFITIMTTSFGFSIPRTFFHITTFLPGIIIVAVTAGVILLFLDYNSRGAKFLIVIAPLPVAGRMKMKCLNLIQVLRSL